MPNHPAITPGKLCIFDVCLVTDEEVMEDNLVSIQILPECYCAVLRINAIISKVHAAWDWMISDWLPQSGWARAQHAPCFQRFLTNADDTWNHGLEIELCLPVKKVSE